MTVPRYEAGNIARRNGPKHNVCRDGRIWLLTSWSCHMPPLLGTFLKLVPSSPSSTSWLPFLLIGVLAGGVAIGLRTEVGVTPSGGECPEIGVRCSGEGRPS